MFFVELSHGSNVVDQRSGGGQNQCTILKRRKRRFPNIGMLDAKIPSALKKIILLQEESQSVGAQRETQDRFLRGRQIACGIYEYFRVTGAHEAVLDFSDLVNLIPDGTRLYHLRKNCPTVVFWKVCTRCVYESLSNS